MAEIRFEHVGFEYPTSLSAPVPRLFQIRRESNMEDLPRGTQRGILALEDVNLTVPDGQTFVIVGPSGCGKSTLLRVAAGIERNYSGHVFYDGVDMKDIPPGERYIGMVFQNYALYPNFNNEGNLSFFFKMHEIREEETRQRIEYTSELMGIGFKELLPRKPGKLSGGEKQRVAIARAIVRSPKVFLFDEPLSSLDAKLRVQTRAEIKRLLHRFGITSLYVTHDQVEAVALADRIVVMHAGRIEQVGTYDELTQAPASIFVAGFLGLPPMDLFPSGSISGGRLIVDGIAFPLPKRSFPIVRDGQQVILGTRREDVKVSTVSTQRFSGERMPDGTIQFRAEVEALEPDLARRVEIVYIRMGRIACSGLCPMEEKPRLGQWVYVQLDPGRLHFFDTQTGRRL